MRTETVNRERTFLAECFEVPAVRDRLEKGIKLQEFAQMKKFLEDNRAERFVQKEYGYMIQGLEFLELQGALKMPVVSPGRYVSVVSHWVALRGYFNANELTLAREGIQIRFVINTPAVLAPLLVLDTDAWTIYRKALSFAHLNRYQGLPFLMYILEVLQMSGMPLGEIVTDDYIKFVVTEYDHASILDEAAASYGRLIKAGLVHDPMGQIPRLILQTCCLPTNSWIFSDGWYYLMSLPSSAFVCGVDDDCSGNYIENWDFFTCEI